MRIRLKSIVLPAAAGIAAALFVTCFLGTMTVRGNAMEPSIPDGSIIFINKVAYFYQKPEPGDVVAFHCNVYSEDGEGVRITEGNLYVNDNVCEEYSEQHIYLDPMNEIIVGKDRVFVFSDSQTAVLDSRDPAVGQLKTDELTGKVCFR